MEINQLRAEFISHMRDPKIAEYIEQLTMFSDIFLRIVQNHPRKEDDSELQYHGKIIMQMMAVKTLHLNKLSEGVSYLSKDLTTRLNNILDPTIIAQLVRNIFETTALFNLLFRSSKSEEEKLIIHNLWRISGLSYRQRFTDVITQPENRAKSESEKQQIDQYINEIENTGLYKSLDGKEQKKIHGRIKDKEFLLRIENNKVNYLVWWQMVQQMQIDERLFNHMYSFFSQYSHPSYVSVFQFAQMFSDDRDFYEMAEFNLHNASLICSIFLADFIYAFPEAKETFEQLPIINQILLNANNKLARGEDFSINDAFQALG